MTDIAIVGLGVSSIHQLTREAEQALYGANEILYLDTGLATPAFLAERCARVRSLYDRAYRDGAARLADYRHMAAAVLDAALDHAPVAFAVHGHPLVAVHAPFIVIDAARVLGLSVAVIPGISTFDTIVAALGIDPSASGLQIHEATDLLLRKRPLQPDVPALILQIGNLETRLHSSRISRPARFHRLVAHLGNYYPVSHRALAVHTSPHPLVGHDVIDTTIAGLPDHAAAIHSGHSLYLPAASERPVGDFDLLAKIDSRAHLDTVTVAHGDAGEE